MARKPKEPTPPPTPERPARRGRAKAAAAPAPEPIEEMPELVPEEAPAPRAKRGRKARQEAVAAEPALPLENGADDGAAGDNATIDGASMDDAGDAGLDLAATEAAHVAADEPEADMLSLEAGLDDSSPSRGPSAAETQPAARWDRATDAVTFDWPAIERTASTEGPNQAMAKLLVAARAEGANSRWPL